MPRERGQKVVASNRKARHDYTILDTYEAGMALSGPEVKSLRAGRASLIDGFASIDAGEAWLENVHIPEYTQATWNNSPSRRKRKLLLHREEILETVNQSSRNQVLPWCRCLFTSKMAAQRLKLRWRRGKNRVRQTPDIKGTDR